MTVTTSEALAVLDRTPQLLRVWLAGLPEDLLAADEGPGTFSPRDVVAHLLQGEIEDWMPRLRTILQDGEARAFEPFDRFGFRERFVGRALSELLDLFEERRSDNLLALRALRLTEEQLAETGTHPDFGRVTARQLLATWVVHDLSHLGQVARVMAKHLAEDVGPWRAYLPILAR